MTTPFNLASFADKVSSTGTANPSAISDIANTSTGALGFPVGTTAQRNGTPVNGMTRINSTTNVLEVYYNGSWVTISTFTPPGPTVIGQAYGGGYYAGKISTTGNGVATHYLIIAPKATGYSATLSWQNNYTTSYGQTSLIAGPTNTSYLATNGVHDAASFCENLTIGGYTDWYLPAESEMITLYYFLKADTTANDTSSGSNQYAVSPQPINTNFSSGSPAQTSASVFQTGGAEAFTGGYYWTSTEASAGGARLLSWDQGGLIIAGLKTDLQKVRAVRRVAI